MEKVGSCILTFYNNGKANIMLVDNFLVEEDYRRLGLGTKMLKKAISVARKRKVDSIELVVNKDNKAAKKLYEKVGFKKTKKDYYRLILRKFE